MRPIGIVSDDAGLISRLTSVVAAALGRSAIVVPPSIPIAQSAVADCRVTLVAVEGAARRDVCRELRQRGDLTVVDVLGGPTLPGFEIAANAALSSSSDGCRYISMVLGEALHVGRLGAALTAFSPVRCVVNVFGVRAAEAESAMWRDLSESDVLKQLRVVWPAAPAACSWTEAPVLPVGPRDALGMTLHIEFGDPVSLHEIEVALVATGMVSPITSKGRDMARFAERVTETGLIAVAVDGALPSDREVRLVAAGPSSEDVAIANVARMAKLLDSDAS